MPQTRSIGRFRSSPRGESAESIVERKAGAADVPCGGGIGGRGACSGAYVQLDDSDRDVEISRVEGGDLIEVGEDLRSC